MLASVVTGDLRLIGPAPKRPNAIDSGGPAYCCAVIPGLLSAHRLRHRTGIGYGAEPMHMDQSPLTKNNLGMMARFCVAEILAGGHRPTPDHLVVDGIRIVNTTMRETLSWSLTRAADRRTSVLCFVNADCLNQAVDNAPYRLVLQHADRVVADGIGVRLAARFAGYQVRENVNGTDYFPQLCRQAAQDGVSLFLLGARPGVAEATAAAMEKAFPGLRIAGHQHGYFTADEQPDVVAAINASGAGILLVALGAPRQELWIDEHREALEVGLALGVGGLFDFYSGRLPRAPHWMREMGLEWVWRLAQEPSRMWRRYLIGNPRFLLRTWGAGRRTPDPALSMAATGPTNPSVPSPRRPHEPALAPTGPTPASTRPNPVNTPTHGPARAPAHASVRVAGPSRHPGARETGHSPRKHGAESPADTH